MLASDVVELEIKFKHLMATMDDNEKRRLGLSTKIE